MKLSQWKKEYYFHTAQVSNLVRQIALAGIAVVWIFKNTQTEVPLIPDKLVFPVTMLFICLGLDLLQYLYLSIRWGIFHRFHERKTVTQSEPDPDIKANPLFNYPALGFFYLKIVAIGIGYSGIFSFLLDRI